MLEIFVTDALKRLPESPATMIHRIYQKDELDAAQRELAELKANGGH